MDKYIITTYSSEQRGPSMPERKLVEADNPEELERKLRALWDEFFPEGFTSDEVPSFEELGEGLGDDWGDYMFGVLDNYVAYATRVDE